MASKSASHDENDSAFQQDAAKAFSNYLANAQDFSGIFGQLAADKGLANYDKNDQLKTMLKDIINANKDALSAVTTMVYNIPTLGPILGPSKPPIDVVFPVAYRFSVSCLRVEMRD